MAKCSEKVYEDNEKWKKDLIDAGFSHSGGTRIICYDCGLMPRFDSEDKPFDVHAQCFKNCKFVKEQVNRNVHGNAVDTEHIINEKIIYNRSTSINAESTSDTENCKYPKEHDEARPDFTESTTSRTNDIGQKMIEQTREVKIPIQECMVRENDDRSNMSDDDQHEKLMRMTHCRKCSESLRGSSVVVSLPCRHMQCKACASFEKKLTCCDTPITDQFEIYWP